MAINRMQMKQKISFSVMLLLFAALLCSVQAHTEGHIRVAVIDSGVSLTDDRILQGYNFLAGSTDTTDNKGHGSKIAETILNIAPDAQIVPLKCTEQNQITDNSAIISAIKSAVDAFSCDVINVSIGMPDSAELKSAVEYATKKGAVIISAVGNDGELSYKQSKIYYPAGYEQVVGVGSVDENKMVCSFSQRNESVFLTTAGSDGTSFAAARVSGAAALAKGFDRLMTWSAFKGFLKEACIDCGDTGYDTSYGNGIFDMQRLMRVLPQHYPLSLSQNGGVQTLINRSEDTTAAVLTVYTNGNEILKRNTVTLLPKEEITLQSGTADACYLWQGVHTYILLIKIGVGTE